MSNRKIATIVKNQQPLVMSGGDTVGAACKSMWERHAGSTLVIDQDQRLVGIFTGRDAVRILAEAEEPQAMTLASAMTRNPVTVTADSRAIDALRAMCEGGFRHVPVIDDHRIWGVVSRGDLKGMELEELHRCLDPRCAGAPQQRSVGDIVGDQKLLALSGGYTVRQACRLMWARKAGSVLVLDARKRLSGIFTGRDAVHTLASAKSPAFSRLSKAMTRAPTTVEPDRLAVEALRSMCDGGFRHLPVVDPDGRVVGVVSRNDFTAIEIDHLDEEEHLAQCLR